MLRSEGYSSIARTAVMNAGVSKHLARGAIVLERIARGGGATNFYWCASAAQLPMLEDVLRPGSVVSFYFDDTIKRGKLTSTVVEELKRAVARTRAAVVGVLAPDGFHIDVEDIVSGAQLDEYVSTVGPEVEVHYGEFPGRDNDGKRAITLTLPDVDGIVRPHPH